jgi:hypothetical protein
MYMPSSEQALGVSRSLVRMGHAQLAGHATGRPPLATTGMVEWGVHPADDKRGGWTTLLISTSGRFRMDLSAGSMVLADQGERHNGGRASIIRGRR